MLPSSSTATRLPATPTLLRCSRISGDVAELADQSTGQPAITAAPYALGPRVTMSAAATDSLSCPATPAASAASSHDRTPTPVDRTTMSGGSAMTDSVAVTSASSPTSARVSIVGAWITLAP